MTTTRFTLDEAAARTGLELAARLYETEEDAPEGASEDFRSFIALHDANDLNPVWNIHESEVHNLLHAAWGEKWVAGPWQPYLTVADDDYVFECKVGGPTGFHVTTDWEEARRIVDIDPATEERLTGIPAALNLLEGMVRDLNGVLHRLDTYVAEQTAEDDEQPDAVVVRDTTGWTVENCDDNPDCDGAEVDEDGHTFPPVGHLVTTLRNDAARMVGSSVMVVIEPGDTGQVVIVDADIHQVAVKLDADEPVTVWIDPDNLTSKPTTAPVLDDEDAAWLAKDAADVAAHRAEEARAAAFQGQPGYTNLHDTADLLRHLRDDHKEEPDPAASHSKLWQQHYSLHYAAGVSLIPFENWSTTHRHTD